MPRKSWLDSVTGALAQFDAMQSLGNIQRQLDKVEFRKNPGLWMWTKPASLGIDALSTVGRPIAAAGGAIGALGSEAANEAGSLDAAKMAWEGTKQGWSEGDDTFKDTIGALDIASLGAGTGAGLALKGSRLASALGKADLALSAADATLGGGQIYEGVRDKDWAKLGMGAFRVAGNAYGATQAAKALRGAGDAADAAGEAAEALGRPTTIPRLLETKPRKPNWSHKRPISGVLHPEENGLSAIEKGIDFDTVKPHANPHDDVYDGPGALADAVISTPDMRAKVYKANDRFVYKDEESGEEFAFKTHVQRPDAEGELYTIESLDDITDVLKARNGQPTTAEPLIQNQLANNPQVDAFVAWIRGLDADGQNDLIGSLSSYLDETTSAKAPLEVKSDGTVGPRFDGGNNPLTLLANAGKFRGLFVGGNAEGFTWSDKLKTKHFRIRTEADAAKYGAQIGETIEIPVAVQGPGIKINDDGTVEYTGTPKPHADKAYYLDPMKVTWDVEDQFDNLLSNPQNGTAYAVQQYVQSLPREMQDYIHSVWDGGPRSPELDLRFKAELFFRTMTYNALHEAFGHARPDTSHTPIKEGGVRYRTDVMGVDGKEVGLQFNRTRLKGRDPGKYSAFETLHNAIIDAMNDPSMLRRSKSLSFRQKVEMYQAFTGESTAMKDRVKFARDRAMGRAETKALQKPWPQPLKKKGAAATPAVDKAAALTKLRDVETQYAQLVEKSRTANWTAADEAKMDALSEEIVSLRAQVRGPSETGGQPPTPPSSTPPGSGGGPIGPQLEPLAKRIKNALTEHQRAVNQNALKKAEINAHRAELLRQNEEKFFQQQISHDDFTAEARRIMSGKYDLIGSVDPLVVEGGDAAAFMQKIASQAQDDAFVRQRGQIAFDKMLKGERLETNEIQLMRQVLGDREEALMADPFLVRLGRFFANATGGMRATMTAYDLSAAGRQALYGTIMNPKEAKEAFKAQLAALRMTRPEFDSFMMRLKDPTFNPYAEIAEAAGLHFSESASKGADKAEEAFMSGKWAEKLPGVKQSEQAYIAYLNKLRVELFNKHLKVLKESGTPLLDEDMGVTQVVKDLAYMVNTLTGRGELSAAHISPNSPLGRMSGLKETYAPGKASMDKMHQGLTTVFFAPRFAASRAALMRDTVQAMLGGGLDPAVSRMYMKNVIGTIGVMTSTVGALAAMGVGTFQADPRKKDFGVLKVGNTRYDVYGGLKPWAKITATIGSDKYWSGRNRIPKMYGDGPMAKTKKGEVGRFVQSKLSPLAGFMLEGLTGEDFMGRKSKLWENAYSHATPMILQTIIDLYNEDELEQLPYAVPASLVGIGVNTYSERRFNKRER